MIMKKYLGVLALLAIVSCKDTAKENEIAEKKADVVGDVEYVVFGDSITTDGAISQAEMFQKFNDLKEGDTIDVKFKSSIEEICQKKGCWMSLDLGNHKTTFVKFKDYGFFVPKNAHNLETVVNGKAFVNVIGVDELKHYAKDEGKTQEQIDSITEPQVTYSFLADGVLIAKK